MKVLILAGGGGTRLWPLSKSDFPKQFLRFEGEWSLLQKTVRRFLGAPFATDLVVATSANYRPLVEAQLSKIDPEKRVDVLVEPLRRSTLPAIALGVKYFEEKGARNDEVVLVIPSDQMIEPESVFLHFVEEIETWARKGRIVLFGIRPTRPETGYGYIQIGERGEGMLYRVKRFVEKPDRKTAERYLQSDDTYWNAGIFAFTPQTFWGELEKCCPVAHQLMRSDFVTSLSRFGEMPDVSIDYGMMEKTDRVMVCPLPISWSDVGCWDSVYEILDKDENENVKIGNVLDVDTKKSLIFGGKKLIATLGLEDVLIVDTEEAIFISKKGESQKVRQLVERLCGRETKA